ncbi:MAG TPA: restriction endonuclease [Acidimicrobiales bacterium]
MSFTVTKREVAADVISLLRHDENRYQGVALDLLVRLSQFDSSFRRLARLDDGAAKVAIAQAALSEVKAVVETYSAQAAAREQVRAEAEQANIIAEQRRSHRKVLEDLKNRFLALASMADAHERGRRFERLLNELFSLFDLHPRAAYSLEHEQIDGAFNFQTDDYLLEAKWWSTPLEPKHLNDFKVKIDGKARHVFGLLVAVGGFTAGAVALHSRGTPLILMDGADLYAILEGRISLTEALERKRRHAAETGSPMLPISQMVD